MLAKRVIPCLDVDQGRVVKGTNFVNLQDAGDIHFIGAKLTYEQSFSRDSPLYIWAGIGPGWFKTRRFAQDDDGFGMLGEVGLGYVINDTFRLRLGTNIMALNTRAGRMLPANDGSRRWVTTVAVVAGIEIDL